MFSGSHPRITFEQLPEIESNVVAGITIHQAIIFCDFIFEPYHPRTIDVSPAGRKHKGFGIVFMELVVGNFIWQCCLETQVNIFCSISKCLQYFLQNVIFIQDHHNSFLYSNTCIECIIGQAESSTLHIAAFQVLHGQFYLPNPALVGPLILITLCESA